MVDAADDPGICSNGRGVGHAVMVSAGVMVAAVMVSNAVGVMAPERNEKPCADPQHRSARALVDVREDPNAGVVARGDGRERLAGAHRVDTTVDVAAMVCMASVVGVVLVVGPMPVVVRSTMVV
jgi:hypothetical protein